MHGGVRGGEQGLSAGDFTINLPPQSRAFTRALQTEKLKSQDITPAL